MKPKERTILLSVMEERVIYYQDKVKRLKNKLKQVIDEKDENE